MSSTNQNERVIFDRSDKDFSISAWLRSEIKFVDAEIKEKKDNYKTTKVSENLFKIVTSLVLLVLATIAAVTYLKMPTEAELFGTLINPRWVVYTLLVMYLLAGFRSIDTSQVGGLDFAGKPVWQFDNGLKWFPWLVFRLTVETVHLIQGEFPGDADRIFWGGEKEPLPTGMVRPIYILSGENSDGVLPSDKQTNLGVSTLTKFRVIKRRFFDLVINIAPIDKENEQKIRETMTGNQSVSLRLLEVLRHLRDTSAAFASDLVGKLSYNEITTHRSLIDSLYKKTIELTILEWGLQLEESRFTNINPGHTFNVSMLKRSDATNDRDAMVLRAEGERKDRMLKGKGDASARQAFLKAEAVGQKAIRDSLVISGDKVIEAEVGKEIAKGGNAVIASGIGGLGALFAAGTEKAKQTQAGGSDDSE